VPKQAGRDGLLADIRGGARLRKVADSEKRDRSAAAVPGAEPASAAPTSAGGAGGGSGANGGMAGALASALAARKAKVSHSGEFSLDLCGFETCFADKEISQMTRKTTMTGDRFALATSQ
jgi:Wiskott-Aldrich syndrome protein